METKTKFDIEDTVCFLSADDCLYDGHTNNKWIKENEIFVVVGMIHEIKIETGGSGSVGITYRIRVIPNNSKEQWLWLPEEMLSPDIVQLGIDVSKRFYVSGVREKRKNL